MASSPASPYRYLFGPVPSRRLGYSLGLDLIPSKTCSFDCVYCQVGRTTQHTLERREWVPTADVLAEVEQWAASGGKADTVTLAGSGEPTLHTRFGEILETAGRIVGAPTTILTNGSLFGLPEVRDDAARADRVKVTFSAPDEAMWQRLHRPTEGVRFEDFLDGLRRFRDRFHGTLWLEVMVVRGINDSDDAMQRLARLATGLHPDSVQFNTPVRPAADADVRPLDTDRLLALASHFDPPAEVIGEFRSDAVQCPADDLGGILELLRRHPSTAEDISQAFGLPLDAANRHLSELCEKGAIRPQTIDGRTYYGERSS
jgi:wyosine [tRNA(Phe)-imidazoG37] synthetase (radical SAM superfamily)